MTVKKCRVQSAECGVIDDFLAMLENPHLINFVNNRAYNDNLIDLSVKIIFAKQKFSLTLHSALCTFLCHEKVSFAV